jgi:hypothetical protein
MRNAGDIALRVKHFMDAIDQAYESEGTYKGMSVDMVKAYGGAMLIQADAINVAADAIKHLADAIRALAKE